jgi:aspartate carbamoyltransferase catalytic subunit
MRVCRTHNEHLEVLKICRIHQNIFLIKKNVTEIRLQNPVVNDGSGQSIYPTQNLVQMKGICTLS